MTSGPLRNHQRALMLPGLMAELDIRPDGLRGFISSIEGYMSTDRLSWATPLALRLLIASTRNHSLIPYS